MVARVSCVQEGPVGKHTHRWTCKPRNSRRTRSNPPPGPLGERSALGARERQRPLPEVPPQARAPGAEPHAPAHRCTNTFVWCERGTENTLGSTCLTASEFQGKRD